MMYYRPPGIFLRQPLLVRPTISRDQYDHLISEFQSFKDGLSDFISGIPQFEEDMELQRIVRVSRKDRIDYIQSTIYPMIAFLMAERYPEEYQKAWHQSHTFTLFSNGYASEHFTLKQLDSHFRLHKENGESLNFRIQKEWVFGS